MRLAICNELYEGWNFADVCRSVASFGYSGIEVAPFTQAPLITDLTTAERTKLRRDAEGVGLEIIGLHWLFAKTIGFHITTSDKAIRQRTTDYLIALAHACADLGGKVLVLGSPTARNLVTGVSPEQAYIHAAECLRAVTGVLEERQVELCLEPLSTRETDFLTTAAEGVRLMEMIGHPMVRLHLDVKAMSSEATPIPSILREFGDRMGHFHANDTNLRGPGMGEVDFRPIFAALKAINYDRWVSVEAFDFRPDPETVARESIEYMKQCLADAKS